MNVSMRYSEAFKQQVLRELGEGKHESVTAALRAYGIGGSSTIQRWMRRYGRQDLLRKVIQVQTPKEVSELKKLRKRVRELEKALADAHMDLKLEDAYLELACEEAGIEDVEEFKKKHGGKQ